MHRKVPPVSALLVLTLLCTHKQARAQGEGPRVYLPLPVGTQRIVSTFMGVSSSFNLQQVILLSGANVRSNVGVLTYARFFALAGQLSQLYASAIYGSIGGSTVRVVNGVRASVSAPRQTPKHLVWLEVVPSVTMFTPNDAPFGPAERRTQDPLWVVAGTVSYNIMKPCWIPIDLRGQAGGETTTDDVPDGNQIGTLAIAGTLAYTFLPKLTGQVSATAGSS